MTQTTTRPAPAASRRRWVGLAALLTAEAMNLLDATIVQVAAPTMRADLGGSATDIQWFSAAYTLPFAVLLVSGGRLGDIVGRRRMFRIGVTMFLLASLACAFAPSAMALIGFRVVQGAAAAAIIPQTIGLIKAMFDGDDVAKALGTIGPVMGLAGVAGPVLGGVLTHADLFGTSWRAVFLVNAPLAVAVLALTGRIAENRAPRRPGLDPVGTILVVASATLIVCPLIGTGDPGAVGAGAWTWLLVGAGVLTLAVFAGHQRRTSRRGGRPLLETSLFRGRPFPAALAISTLFFAVTNGLLLVIVVHLQLSIGANSLTAGLTLLPWSAGLGIASYAAGSRLVPRYGDRVMFLGLATLTVGIAFAVGAYYASDPGRYPVWLLPALVVCGLGVGLFTPAFFTSALHHVQPQEIGSAAGLLNAVQQLGAALGVAVLGSLFFHYDIPAAPGQASVAVQIVFAVAGVVVIASATMATLMTGRRGVPY
ncbi:MAG: MFS transporter [Streptosporangiales bacterium]|nr:MFS transporter [Streptosporangiales bacterium]